MRWLIGMLSLFCLLIAVPAAAQEVQVPLDEAGRIDRVDRALAQRLRLWVDEYPGFQEARLFQAADSSFTLEITVSRDGRLVRQRLPRSAGEVAELRARISRALEARAEVDERGDLNQEGRYLLLGQTTVAGVFFYGWAVPTVVGADDGGSAAGLYLLTAASSFFGPFVLTENRPVTYGMANLSRYGVTRGIYHGVLLHNLLVGEEEREEPTVCSPDAPCYVDTSDDDYERGIIAGALLGSVAEGVGGYLWARNERMSAGTANAIAGGGDLGLFWGLGTALLVGTDHINVRSTAAIALPITAGGILGAHRVAKRRDYTWGDADLIYTGAAVGVLGGVAAADLLGGDDEKLFTAAAMLGSAAGVYLGDRMVRYTDFSVGQATLNRLGAIAGALAGASLGAMAEQGTVALTGAALGAAAGYALTYSALAPDAPAGRGERMPSASAWQLRVEPQGLLSAATGREPATGSAPLLSVRYRF